MTIYRLRLDEIYWGYDRTMGVMVRANSPEDAFDIAIEHLYGDDKDVWTKDNCTIEEITTEGESEILLEDFNAG